MTLRLTRLDLAVPIANPDGTPATQFHRIDQKMKEALEAQEAAQDALIADLAAAVADLQATMRRDAISGSFTVPSNVLTGEDAGADARIVIAAHVRRYGDETPLSVGGATLTGLAYSTDYAVYYDDSTRADTTPAYVATTNLATAQNNYAAGRHLVGTVTTPAAAAPATTGGTAPPGSGYTPGGGGGYVIP